MKPWGGAYSRRGLRPILTTHRRSRSCRTAFGDRFMGRVSSMRLDKRSLLARLVVFWLFLPALGPSLGDCASTRGIGPSLSPVLRVDDREYDWGKLVQGDIPRHSYTLHNDGTAALEIHRVRSSCGCTKIEWTKTIEPGKSGIVTIALDTKSLKARRVYKVATIESNDPQNPSVELILGGVLQPVFEQTPAIVSLAGRAGDTKKAVIAVTPGFGNYVGFAEARSLMGHVRIEEIDRPPSNGFRVEVSAFPSTVAKTLRDIVELTVECSDGKRRRKRIPVIVEHRGSIYADRRSVVFNRSDTAGLDTVRSNVVRSFLVSAEGDEAIFNILDVKLIDLPEELFAVDVETVVDGRCYRVDVRCVGRPAGRFVRGKLKILTDHVETKDVSVTVFAQFSGRRSTSGR